MLPPPGCRMPFKRCQSLAVPGNTFAEGFVAELTALPAATRTSRRVEGQNPGRSTKRCGYSQSGDHPTVLVHRAGSIVPFCGRGLGNQGGRPVGEGSWDGISRSRGLQPPQPAVHAFRGRGLARPRNSASSWHFCPGVIIWFYSTGSRTGSRREWYLRAAVE